MKSAVILISGRGSNMRAIIDADLPLRIAAVVSNRRDAAGLAYAAEKGIPTAVLEHGAFPSRNAFDEALARRIDGYGPDLVVLAGFMRILGEGFTRHFDGRLINIHPSLLPAFPGLHTHRRALEQGVKIHGCTVHFVTTQLDHGPVIIQAAVPVMPEDDEDALAERVLRQEHRIYPLAVRWFAEGRLVIENGVVRVQGGIASQSVLAAQ